MPENGQYGFEVYCERIAGQADPYVVLVDDQGNRVPEFDDFGHRINAFDGHLRDPSGTVNLQPKKYGCWCRTVTAAAGRGISTCCRFKKPQPDFFVAAMHPQIPVRPASPCGGAGLRSSMSSFIIGRETGL